MAMRVATVRCRLLPEEVCELYEEEPDRHPLRLQQRSFTINTLYSNKELTLDIYDMEKIEIQLNYFIKIIPDKTNLTITI
eukprot:9910127-Heterocapsa_arctica.AAC.1